MSGPRSGGGNGPQGPAGPRPPRYRAAPHGREYPGRRAATGIPRRKAARRIGITGIGGPTPTGDLMSRVYAGSRRYPAPGTSRDAYQKSPQLPSCRTFAIQVQAAAAVASATTAAGREADPRAVPVGSRGLCGHRDGRHGHPGPRSRCGNRAMVPFGYPAGRAGRRSAEGPERSFPGCPAAAAGRSASELHTSTGSAAGAHNFFTYNRFDIGRRGPRIPRPGGQEISRRTSPPEMRLPGHDVPRALHPTAGSSRRDRPRRPSPHPHGQDHNVEERPAPRPDGGRRPGSTPRPPPEPILRRSSIGIEIPLRRGPANGRPHGISSGAPAPPGGGRSATVPTVESGPHHSSRTPSATHRWVADPLVPAAAYPFRGGREGRSSIRLMWASFG